MEGVGSLPDDWDRFIPDDLMHVQVRDTPITPRARVGSGVDWLSLDVEFVSEGSKVNEDDLRRALLEGRRLVRLEDPPIWSHRPSRFRMRTSCFSATC